MTEISAIYHFKLIIIMFGMILLICLCRCCFFFLESHGIMILLELLKMVTVEDVVELAERASMLVVH
jgi:hypothetical protein